jgi:hypothetical protein
MFSKQASCAVWHWVSGVPGPCSPSRSSADRPIDQQTEAFLEAQLAGGGIAYLLTQGVGHSGQFHGVQLFDGSCINMVVLNRL